MITSDENIASILLPAKLKKGYSYLYCEGNCGKKTSFKLINGSKTRFTCVSCRRERE